MIEKLIFYINYAPTHLFHFHLFHMQVRQDFKNK